MKIQEILRFVMILFMGFCGVWDRADRFTLQQTALGTWSEIDFNLTI
jgi:hypothetical protein